MPRDNLSVVLAKRPVDDIIPGTTFHQKVAPAPRAEDLKDGQILVEVLYLSLDPAMRGWLNGTSSFFVALCAGQSHPCWRSSRRTRTNRTTTFASTKDTRQANSRLLP